jgi:hypothetical protein
MLPDASTKTPSAQPQALVITPEPAIKFIQRLLRECDTSRGDSPRELIDLNHHPLTLHCHNGVTSQTKAET